MILGTAAWQVKSARLYNGLSHPTMAHDDAIVKLARQIDAARKAERFLVNADEVARLRATVPANCTGFARISSPR
jgi:hypothetical protein